MQAADPQLQVIPLESLAARTTPQVNGLGLPLRKAAATSFPHEAAACRDKAEALRTKYGL